MKDTTIEDKPAIVATPKQAGETEGRWSWVERVVWTDRMLAALETGVKGGKWFSLMDKVYTAKNLQASWKRVRANRGSGGSDGISLLRFEDMMERELGQLAKELRANTYTPKPVKRVYIPKPGSKTGRPLGIPAVRDRVVQTALLHVLEPIFENKFRPESYGFRPGRGCKDALRRVQGLLNEGRTWVVDADIRKYFDSISHARLMAEVEKEVADGRVLKLVGLYLETDILDEAKRWTPEGGTPQGAVISPLLANIYLHPLDVAMEEAGFEMVRYADDFVVLCRSESEAKRALKTIQRVLSEMELALHPEKTRMVDATQRGGFEFLGYHFERGTRWPRKRSIQNFKDAVRRKTKRCNGDSLETIVEKLNRTIKGWFEYFKHSNEYTFPELDSWIRMRLRSILRKRAHKRGRGRGSDHQRWPNAFFRSAGLISMHEARRALCRSR